MFLESERHAWSLLANISLLLLFLSCRDLALEFGLLGRCCFLLFLECHNFGHDFLSLPLEHCDLLSDVVVFPT
ncbi:hypothetical protein F5Y18DRAFT_397667 [Xylariaceae sp. FL1019]|nr:hypothetical protein F5Y18DRAFT_397667 [Xylariaceae sp. FL1019]